MEFQLVLFVKFSNLKPGDQTSSGFEALRVGPDAFGILSPLQVKALWSLGFSGWLGLRKHAWPGGLPRIRVWVEYRKKIRGFRVLGSGVCVWGLAPSCSILERRGFSRGKVWFILAIAHGRGMLPIEGQGDLGSRLRIPISHIIAPIIPMMNLLTKSP